MRTRPKPDAADKLRGWLRAAGVTQAELATRMRVTPTAVSAWLSGRRRPSDAAKADLALVTGGLVTPNDWCVPGAARRAA